MKWLSIVLKRAATRLWVGLACEPDRSSIDSGLWGDCIDWRQMVETLYIGLSTS